MMPILRNLLFIMTSEQSMHYFRRRDNLVKFAEKARHLEGLSIRRRPAPPPRSIGPQSVHRKTSLDADVDLPIRHRRDGEFDRLARAVTVPGRTTVQFVREIVGVVGPQDGLADSLDDPNDPIGCAVGGDGRCRTWKPEGDGAY